HAREWYPQKIMRFILTETVSNAEAFQLDRQSAKSSIRVLHQGFLYSGFCQDRSSIVGRVLHVFRQWRLCQSRRLWWTCLDQQLSQFQMEHLDLVYEGQGPGD